MATLDDLEDVLLSIDRTMTDQKNLLTSMFNLQQTNSRLSSVNNSTIGSNAAGVGQGIGSAASGIGQGVGSAAMGLGLGGLAGLAALAMFADFDAQTVKDNVVTLLSISDEVGGKVEMLKEGGTFFLAMAGLGAGLAAFGIGQSIVALGQWVTDDQWTQTLKTNVIDLLSIADEAGGNLSLLYEGGTVGLALGGLGVGLTAFGTGQTLVGLGQWITDDTWAEQVKSNVLTLLSISDGIGDNVSNLYESGVLMSAMIGLGAGLAVFSVGQAAAGLAQFISTDDWAQQVKDNVATLLSISELPGTGWNTVEFIGVMAGIATGLTAFALGKGAATVVEGAAEAIEFFTGDPFAEKIKSEVETLLSIPQMEGVGVDTVEFIGVMAGIATGLTAFALGKGAATVVDGAAEALAYFTSDEPFAEKIKSEVETLLSIIGLAPEGSVDEFTNIMSKLGEGLSAFAGGNFVGTLKNIGTELLGFFFGVESPFEQIRAIAADADNLLKAADALEKIAGALEKFGSIDIGIGDTDFVKLAENLGKAIPLLSALANGGEVEGSDGWLSSPLVFPKSILDPSLKLDEMAEAISKVNYILGQTQKYPPGLQESAAAATKETLSVNGMSEREQAILAEQIAYAIKKAEDSTRALKIMEENERRRTEQKTASAAVVNSGNTIGGTTIMQSKTDVIVGAKSYGELSPRLGRPSNVQ